MKKFLVLLAAVALIAGGLLMLSGCSSSDSDLVGVWEWEGDSSFVTTFNSDGSGSHAIDWTGYGTRFNWSTSRNNIYWEYPGFPRVYTPYNISGDVLTFSLDDGSSFRYIRVR